LKNKQPRLRLRIAIPAMVLLSASLVFSTAAFAQPNEIRTPMISTKHDVNNIGITREIDFKSPIMISNLNVGISQVDNSLSYPWAKNNEQAVNEAKSFINNSISYMNVFTQAWGTEDIWPDPLVSDTTKWDWSGLDLRMQNIVDIGAIPVISLAEAPWWMKGQLQRDGTTKLIPDIKGEWKCCTYADNYTDYRGITYPPGYLSPDPYASRILDNQMSNWTRLVQEIAKRYMIPPYNVRYFQVWNELKGYYNPALNRWSYENNQGDPSGYNAKSGYTYMYNQVYIAIMDAARSLGIPLDNVYIGGPYVGMTTWGKPSAGGWPSYESSLQTKNYGTFDQRAIDVIKYWLQNKIGAGFITLDGSNTNKDNIDLADQFTASEKFADVTTWIRSLDNKIYPGAQTLPIWWAELYTYRGSAYTDDYNNAVKSYAFVKLLQAGASTVLDWGNTGNSGYNAGLWTPTDTVDGGQASFWYNSCKIFHDYFSQGVPIFRTNISNSSIVEAISSMDKTLLINKTSNTVSLTVNKKNISLNPWEVKVIENK
jgi:hypothetical protein